MNHRLQTGAFEAGMRNRSERRYFPSFTCSGPQGCTLQSFSTGQVTFISGSKSIPDGQHERGGMDRKVQNPVPSNCTAWVRKPRARWGESDPLRVVWANVDWVHNNHCDLRANSSIQGSVARASEARCPRGAVLNSNQSANSIRVEGEGNKETRRVKAKMNRHEYLKYIQSDHWKELRTLKAQTAGKKCIVCGVTYPLHCHHIRYKNFTDCTLDDLVMLCEAHHDILHRSIKVFGHNPETENGIIFMLENFAALGHQAANRIAKANDRQAKRRKKVKAAPFRTAVRRFMKQNITAESIDALYADLKAQLAKEYDLCRRA